MSAGSTPYFALIASAFRTWDTARHGWLHPAGTYGLRVGRSSGDLRLTVDVALPGATTSGLDPTGSTP